MQAMLISKMYPKSQNPNPLVKQTDPEETDSFTETDAFVPDGGVLNLNKH